MFKITNFGSSSSGNCTLVEDSNTSILIDAGVRYQTLREQFRMLNLNFNKIDAIIITHEHGDHLSEIKELCNNHNIKVYLHTELYDYVLESKTLTGPMKQLKKVPVRLWERFKEMKSFKIGTLKILPFLVPHDTVTNNSVGYYITNPLNENLCYITDTGMVEHITLKNIDVLMIECNYDDFIVDYKLSKNLINRNVVLRLTSNEGHLSLEQTCDFIKRHNDKLQQIVILHYSKLNTNYDSLTRAIQSVAQSNVVFAKANKVTILEYQDKIQKRELV